MLAANLKVGGMTKKAQKGAFTLYSHLSWTGRIMIGEDGACFSTEVLDLCASLQLGSVGIVVDSKFGVVVDARADNGDNRYLEPTPEQRLIVATADPVDFTPNALKAIASAMIGGDEVLKLSEVQSANARHFIARLHDMGIGDPPEHIL
jgi:hypothetical protein